MKINYEKYQFLVLLHAYNFRFLFENFEIKQLKF